MGLSCRVLCTACNASVVLRRALDGPCSFFRRALTGIFFFLLFFRPNVFRPIPRILGGQALLTVLGRIVAFVGTNMFGFFPGSTFMGPLVCTGIAFGVGSWCCHKLPTVSSAAD